MRRFNRVITAALCSAMSSAILAPAAYAQEDSDPYVDEIIVTAQRQAQSLQDVPIAVSAFTQESLESRQIENSSDLQLTLPNITFTKTNFTGSSFTIRGVGDLCVGVSCDAATGIHINDMPLLASRLFETEFFDLERVEVLRGPQGTLFGRNATSGVVNVITAKPTLGDFSASGDVEYGNFKSIKAKAMINVPIGETLAFRGAGYFVKRDGYTTNISTGNDIDGRELFAVRGSLRWEPSPDTTVDLMGYYFREKDNRSRIQKQLCHRDPTGVLGCLPDRLGNETLNGNATLASILTSNQFLAVAISPAFAPLGLGSIYGPDTFRNAVSLSNVRQVAIDYEPTYFADEQVYMGTLQQRFGKMNLTVTGGYSSNTVNSTSDYNLAIEAPLTNNPGLLALQAFAANPFFTPIRNALTPTGAAGAVCQSDTDPTGVGVYGGNAIGCFASSLDFDRSQQKVKQWSGEAHLDSDFDGPLNFLIGGLYLDSKTLNNSYYVNAFGLDYAAGLLGAASASGGASAGVPVYRGTPFYRNFSPLMHLKSYGLFGEAYFEASDKLKLTVGVRYNNDKKFVRARTTLFNDANGNALLLPFNADDITDTRNYANVDFDSFTTGNQEFSERNVAFDKITGRAVLDYKVTDDNLLYASYSRGYKSGGVNPPLSAIFAVPQFFDPESIDAFEIGSKNSFADGAFTLNLTGFFYKYKDLQLSRIVARTSVNDNVDADIYGLEAEAIIAPSRDFIVNLGASYLHTKISSDKFLSDTRDPSGGRSDAVIIKDLTNASNCAVFSTSGSKAGVNGFVGTINTSLGLNAPVAVPGTTATGAFSICSVLQAQASAIGRLFGGIGYAPSGVEVNIKGNQLPQAPTLKFSAGAQYTHHMGGGMTLVPRLDLSYTGESSGSVFNGNVNRIAGYEVVNAQVQLNGADDRWYVRGFVQNLTKNSAITGLYVTDASSGLFTNVFTLDPRRYGLAAGFKF